MSFLIKEEEGSKTVAKFIKDLGGEIGLEGPVMKIALSYPIKKQESGFFGYFHFAFPPGEVRQLEHEMETSLEVLRHLIITPPFKKQESRPRAEAPRAVSPVKSAPSRAPEAAKTESLTNEDLEKKIEEILG